MQRPPIQYTFYLGGELFSQKHLIGNALLAKEIYQKSNGRFLPILPQDLEFRSTNPQDIRDQDLLTLLQSDLALFHFDGPELDSGTVVEFMFAKFADIPSVVIRTDFRDGGDQGGKGDPWNLMGSFYPRTETLHLSCLETSEEAGHQRQNINNYSAERLEQNVSAQLDAISITAQKIINAFNAVLKQPTIVKPNLITPLYEHLQHLPGYNENPENVQRLIQRALKQKQEKGLL